MRKGRTENPLHGWGVKACALRFVLAALFGLMLETFLVLILIHWMIALETLFSTAGAPFLVLFPIGWGVLGVFFFEEAIGIVRRFFGDDA